MFRDYVDNGDRVEHDDGMFEPRAQRQIDRWLASLASPNTRAAYRADLAAFTAWCRQHRVPVLAADSEAVERFRADLEATGTSPSTARRRASAVQSFLRATQPGRAEAPAPTSGTSSTPALSAEERLALLDALPAQASKGQVVVAMLLLDGLKLDEVLAFDAEDITGRPPRLEVSVRRDESHHDLALHPTTSQIVAAHLADRARGPLLSGRGPAGARMTRFGADYLVKQAGRDAGLEVPLTTNMLRRSYVTQAHAAGGDLEDIRWQVGHDDVRTTRRYLPNTRGR
jgi:site-specific recombinase XerD